MVAAANANFPDGKVRAITGGASPDLRAAGLVARVIYTFPAEEGQTNSAAVRTLWGNSGGVDSMANLLASRILIKFGRDIRQLRAWTFTQDDHDFYVLNLGDTETLVYDRLTGQWAQWKSPGFAYWRGNDGVQWEGWNICCDSESGKLWIIDPEGRLDEETTPITSIVTGGISTRMRKFAPCFMAELALSEGQPPTGIAEGSVALSLRTSDDGGLSFTNHGSIAGEGIGEDITVRWYGLGIIPPNGRVFEITDTGYARRIDGFNVEVGGDG